MITINQGAACHSSNYYNYRSQPIQYIVIHYTANNGDTAQGNCTYFSSANRSASAHYFVGDDGIFQSVQDNFAAWAVGGTKVYKHLYCRNMNSISIEMCSRKDSNGNFYIKDNVVSQTVELTKYLMEKYGIDADHVLRHYDVWDKQCPEPFVRNPQLWTDFKQRLTSTEEEIDMEELKKLEERVAALEESTKPEMCYNYIDSNMPEWARESVQWLVDNGLIEGTGEGLNLSSTKLWVCVVLYRVVKYIAKLINVKV